MKKIIKKYFLGCIIIIGMLCWFINNKYTIINNTKTLIESGKDVLYDNTNKQCPQDTVTDHLKEDKLRLPAKIIIITNY